MVIFFGIGALEGFLKWKQSEEDKKLKEEEKKRRRRPKKKKDDKSEVRIELPGTPNTNSNSSPPKSPNPPSSPNTIASVSPSPYAFHF